TTVTSSAGDGVPRAWILRSYWSLQKYGTRAAVGAAPPSRAVTSSFACSPALVQCSTRLRTPVSCCQAATSPTAQTPSAEVRLGSSAGTPRPALGSASSTLESASQSVTGTEPTPTTTRSAGTSVPSVSTAPRTRFASSVSRVSTPTPQRRST